MRTFLLLFTLLSLSAAGQKVFTKQGRISFYSKAPLEDIEAHNGGALGVIDQATGRVEFSVLMKGFEFEKALMQEHFNENYVESSTYPKAVFKGTFQNKIAWAADGTSETPVPGTLTLHGVTRAETAKAVVTVKAGTVSATADMQIKLADYGIKIPSVVGNKISETIRITVNVPAFAPLNR